MSESKSKAGKGAKQAAPKDAASKKRGRDEEKAEGAPAAKRARLDACYVVMSLSHTDCYKRADPQLAFVNSRCCARSRRLAFMNAKVSGVYSNEEAAQRHALEKNLLEYTQDIDDERIRDREVHAMLKAWLPHEGPEITIKEKKSNDEGEEEEEEDEPEEGIEISHEQIKAALKIVPRDKLAALLKQSLELLDSRPAEFTMQPSGTWWSVSRQEVRDTWTGKASKKQAMDEGADDDDDL